MDSLQPMNPASKYQCRYCDKTFSTASNRSKHTTIKHALERQRQQSIKDIFKCQICTRGFISSVQLKSHVIQCDGVLHSTNNRSNNNNAVSNPSNNNSNNINLPPSSIPFNNNNNNNTNSSGHHHSTISVGNNSATASNETRIIQSVPSNATIAATTSVVDSSTVDAIAAPFYSWLGTCPITSLEEVVKKKRLTTAKELTPTKNNLKYLFNVLLSQAVVHHPSALNLAFFTQIETIQVIHNHFIATGIKHERQYQLMLLIKKLLVYLVGKQSQVSGIYLVPANSIKSWTLVETLAHESCSIRKYEAANKIVGISGSSTAKCIKPSNAQVNMSNNATSDNNSNNAATNTVNNRNNNNNPIATKQELAIMARTTLAFLNNVVDNPEMLTNITSLPNEFQMYLCLAFISLTSTPRTQIIRELSIGGEQTLFRTSNGYEIRVAAEKNKNRKPCLLLVPSVLTRIFDFYIERVRPLLLSKATKSIRTDADNNNNNNNSTTSTPATVVDPGYIFLSKSGTQKSTFCDWIKKLTLQIIKRPLNTHSFRGAITTLYYENIANGDKADLQMRTLSNLMQHDVSTQKKYYWKSERIDDSKRVNDEIANVLGITPSLLASVQDAAQTSHDSNNYENKNVSHSNNNNNDNNTVDNENMSSDVNIFDGAQLQNNSLTNDCDNNANRSGIDVFHHSITGQDSLVPSNKRSYSTITCTTEPNESTKRIHYATTDERLGGSTLDDLSSFLAVD